MTRRLLLLCAVVLAAGLAVVYLHGANIPVLQPAGPVALAERSVMIVTLLLCSIVVVPVFVLLFFFAWKYRATYGRAKEHHKPDWDHTSVAAEVVWWFVPTVIIAILSVVAWQSSHALDPFKPLAGAEPMVIEVVALDWKWLFIYPQEGIATVNFVEFPVDRPVTFELTADAPMNSFWIPQLGGQIMVMPGMQTQLNLMASRVGDFQGSSANISGSGFAGMAFTARSVSQTDFQNWVQSVQQSQSSLMPASYAALAAPSSYVPVTYYSQIQNDLYSSIITKFMLPKSDMMNMSI